ncbi:PucR family transcriptional regulator [Microbacterium sp. Marseille-Q6965]|uniref:PucR family transcriptional regulator n=1 Tax=Microbacterium sp. Marseille-Q6965 TaxID=2965072 RepID=UPI0021B7643B|nr:PucR family transcriptional regulator [Microbacterium sp. Marseille-Q6965]
MNLRELLARTELGLSVIAGEPASLAREVRRGYITDLPDPSRFVEAGDVVLSSGLWTARPGGAERFVHALSSRSVTALVLGTLEIGVVPSEVIELCRAQDVPLLTIAGGVSFREVADAVAAAQPDSPLRQASEGARFRQRLSEVLAGGGGMEALLRLAADTLQAPCWVVDDRGKAVAGEAPAEARGALWNRTVVDGFDRHEAELDGVVRTGLRIGDDPAAGMLGVDTAVPAGDDAIAIEIETLRAALRVELELGRRWRRARIEHTSELVRQVRGHEASPGVISAHLRLNGLDPQAATVAIAARADDPRFPLDAIAAIVEDEAVRAGHRVLAAHVDGAALLLVNGDVPESWAASLTELSGDDVSARLAGRVLTLGAADAIQGVSRLGSAIQTALARLESAQASEGAAVVVATAVHVRSHRELLRLLGDGARRGFAQEVLEPVIEYDRRHGAELLPTLRAFLDGDGAWQETARALHLHTNTLRYRMARIKELTGKDVAKLGERVDLFLALSCLDEQEPPAAL